MSAKKPLIYLAVFALLATVYYFYEYKGGENRQAAGELEKKAVVFSPDSVKSFRLTSRNTETGGLDTVELANTPAGWRITCPLHAPADSQSVAKVLSSAAGAGMNRVVEDSAAMLSKFGLDSPQLTLEIVPFGADTSIGLLLGNKNPTESYIYASNAARPSRVILLNSWTLSDLDKSVHELRDKKLLHLDTGRVDSLVIEKDRGADHKALKLEKEPDGWYLRSPVQAPADRDSVEGLLEKLAEAEAESFIDTLAEGGFRDYGLEPAELTVRVFCREGELTRERTLYIGSLVNSSKRRYARREGMENVFLIEDELAAAALLMREDVSTLRDRTLVRANKDDIKLVSVITPEEKVTAFREEHGEGWHLAEPDSTTADEAKVDGLLWDLKDLKAEKFVEDPADPSIKKAFENPFLEIVYQANDQDGRLSFASASRLHGSLVYVRARGLPGIAVIDSAEAGKLVKSYDDLRDKRIVRFDTGGIAGLRVERPGNDAFELARKDDEWVVVKPEKGAKAKTWKVQNILWDLSEMDFTRIVSKTGEDSSAYGFRDPSLRVLLWKEGHGEPAAVVLTFADSIPGRDEICLRSHGDSRIFGVERSIFRSIPASAEELKKD